MIKALTVYGKIQVTKLLGMCVTGPLWMIFGQTIVTLKDKIVYVMFFPWQVPSLSTGSFSSIRLNIKFWTKYNLNQPILCFNFKISQGAPKWNSNEWSKLLYFSLLKFWVDNLVFIFWKYLKKTVNGILQRGKTLRERILKNISVCEIHYSTYQLIKSM